jgi:hypothetical protein
MDYRWSHRRQTIGVEKKASTRPASGAHGENEPLHQVLRIALRTALS